jgi:LppX_LprAFG lipoprotein
MNISSAVHRIPNWLLIAVIALTVVSPLTAQADEATDSLTATEILQMASKQLAATQTVRFELDVEGDTYIDSLNTLKLLEAKGDLVRPDRVRTEFKIEALGQATISIQLIIISGQWWTTDLITGKWGQAPVDFEYDPSVLFDNENGIGAVMDRVTDAQRLDDEKIDDHESFHIQALVSDTIIGALTYNTLQGSPITVDLWIDKKTNNLLRARLAEPPGDGSDKPAIWTLNLFDHDANITIDPPK